MVINGINGFMPGYNAYNIPSVNDSLQSAKAAQAPKTESVIQPVQEEKKFQFDLTVEESSRENASIENIAISFGQYDSSSIDLFGDMGAASRDMKQAISGMQKDHILHEYQYFVGGNNLTGKESNIIAETEYGIVRKR